MTWLIPSYYITYIAVLVLSVRYLWNKGKSVRDGERQRTESSTPTERMYSFVENSHGKWCDHTYNKAGPEHNGPCIRCGYNPDAINGEPFVAECNCPRCGWRDVHDLEPIIQELYVDPVPEPGQVFRPSGRRIFRGDQVLTQYLFETRPGLWLPVEPDKISVDTGRIQRTCEHCGQTWWQI